MRGLTLATRDTWDTRSSGHQQIHQEPSALSYPIPGKIVKRGITKARAEPQGSVPRVWDGPRPASHAVKEPHPSQAMPPPASQLTCVIPVVYTPQVAAIITSARREQLRPQQWYLTAHPH